LALQETRDAKPEPRADFEPVAGRPRAVLEIHVAELNQLFNVMDPAPFRERDLDPNAEAYILDWARETRPGQPLGLSVRVDRDSTAKDSDMVRDAVREYFRRRAQATRRELRRLFRVGRISLAIALGFALAATLAGEAVANWIGTERSHGIIEGSLIIGAWVALWRPLEIFLYDWWPIREEALLHDRLGQMDVRLSGAGAAARSAAMKAQP